jgi:hypothetical protein
MAKVRGRGKDGDLVRIDLGGGTFGYGRVLPEALMAFYDLSSTEPIAVREIVKAPVLFIVSVMDRAIKAENWEVIGNVPLEGDLRAEPKFFMQDVLSKRFSIYHGGKITPAAREDCVGLERAAVWEGEHIENRLRNYFAGAPDPMTERFKLPDA